MEEDKLIDQTQLAESVAAKIDYEFADYFLVKPLEPVMVKKEISSPVGGEAASPTKVEDEIKAVDYKEVKTEVKEVESDFRKAVILKMPISYNNQVKNDEKYPALDLHVGDVVVFRSYAGNWFDLIKDTRLIRLYDIVAKENI